MLKPYALRIGLALFAAAAASGCKTHEAMATYLLPAREVADVHGVDVLALDATVSLSGNQVAPGDAARVSAMARQMLSSRLYRLGFYRVEDGIWGSPDGASELGRAIALGGSRHGYSVFVTEASPAKAVLKLDLALSYNVAKTTQRQTYELKTTPYVIHRPQGAQKEGSYGSVPFSVPDVGNTKVRNVESSWDAWVSSGSGRLRVSLVPKGVDEAVYTRDFTLAVPSTAGADAPTLIRAVAAALSPAIDEIVRDISPTTEVRPLVLSKGGDARAVTLLEAGVFLDAIDLLDSIPEDALAIGDLENLGIAHEMRGDYKEASRAYERALAREPENEGLRDKMNALARAAKAQKSFKASGAKANSDTSFRNPATR